MFQFTDDCLIGIKELDDEHRRLFSLINQAMDILNHTDSNDRCTQITHLLEELTQYADTHFAHEEAYMEQIRDPELMAQQQKNRQPSKTEPQEQPRAKMSSIGDVTQEEKELILKEETLAGKIAVAEAILKKREEAKAMLLKQEQMRIYAEPITSEQLPQEVENIEDSISPQPDEQADLARHDVAAEDHSPQDEENEESSVPKE